MTRDHGNGTEQVEGTLGALRELTADLPDDTRIEVAIRRQFDDFDFVMVDGECVDLTRKPILQLTVPEPRGV